MKLAFSDIQAITSGAERVLQRPEGIQFSRFTEEQETLYLEKKNQFRFKVSSASGIRLTFRTNSQKLGLKVLTENGSGRKYFSFDVFVNGKMIDALDNFSGLEIPAMYTNLVTSFGEFSKEFCLGEGEKEVTVYFPWSAKVILQELELDNGATVVPAIPKKKLLVWGDSITQGFDALRPSNKYITRIADWLGAEEYNKGIGGDCFWPELADTHEDFTPDYIIAAYGTNDWLISSEEVFMEDCRGFYQNLSNRYPNVQIFAITPLWRVNGKKGERFCAHDQVDSKIRQLVKDLPNVIPISGYPLVPHEEGMFADLVLHPNDVGFDYYFKNLKEAMAVYIRK